MRNYFFYILFICVFTNSFGKNEDEKKSSGKEPVKKTTLFFEQEAKADIENLLSSIKNHSISEEEREPFDVNARSSKLMKRIDNSLKSKKHKKNLRTKAQINAGNFRRYGVYGLQNLPLNLRNVIESINLHNSDAQLMNKVAFTNGGSIKSRIRNSVNYVNIKPEVYPLLYITDDKYGSREIATEKGIVQINHQYYTNDNDKLTKLVNTIDTNHNNETFIRTATIPMSENFDLDGLLNKLDIKQEEIPTAKESETNAVFHDFLNKVYDRSTNHRQPGNRLETVNYNLDELDNIDSKPKDHSKTILLRSDVVDNVKSNTNERLQELMKYMNNGKILRTRRNALSHGQIPARHGDHRSRHRRASGTQAGYTQDPDTCKTYNENLEKLWTNLSKLINIKDQPNDRALHNIAMMIQAYLQHQNAIQPPETHRAKHEGPKDKISQIILRIRKLLDESEGSAEKITKIILKYLKPDYKVVESEDCQQVNEEFLTLSVDLLYKNYFEKTDCQGEDDGLARNKKVILIQRLRPAGKMNNGHSLVTSDLKPHFQNLLTEKESYEDYHKRTTQRLRRPNMNRRVFKPSIQQRSRPVDRSGNQNERESLNTRSKSSSKSTSKRHKKISLKSDVQKSRCEKYATRKLVVSLRPVMERFNGLLECQLDDTLRSVSYNRDLEDSYQRYASEFFSNENSRRDRKVSPRFPVRSTGRKRNESHKNIYIERHGSSFENDHDARASDFVDETDFAWVRKFNFDKTKSANPKAHAEAPDARVSEKHLSNNDYENEYFQSPPSYDYDGVYKSQKNEFPSLINPLMSLNDKKNTASASTSKQVVMPGKAENENDYEYEDLAFYGDSSISPETNDVSQESETSSKKTPFIDLTKLRSDDQLIEEKNKIHVNTFENITEFLKRARDESLKTPEFAVPFALDTNKGYVELTHLIKYPKTLVYRPQFLVKNTMPYDDFLKTINNSNMTNDDVRLMKMVRHLPNGSVQVLFETEDSEAPLEIRNLNDKDTRRNRSQDPVVDYQSESRIDTANKNNNTDLTDGNKESFSLNYRNETHRQDFKSPLKSDSSISVEYLSPDLDLNTDSGTLRGNEKLSQNSYFVDNSDTNSTSNSTPNSLESRSSSFSLDVGKEKSSAVASQQGLGTQTGSGIQTMLDPALKLGLKLKPMHPSPSQLDSFSSKLMPSHSNAQATPNPSINSQSHMDSHFYSSSGSYSASYSHLNSRSGSWSGSSHSLLPNTDSNYREVDKNVFSSPLSIVRWWKKVEEHTQEEN